jgi:hypothetical protein
MFHVSRHDRVDRTTAHRPAGAARCPPKTFIGRIERGFDFLGFALTNYWTALAEYDHIGLPSTTVPFLAVAVINTQNIGVKQSINLFKVGVNYKFDFLQIQ